MERKPHPLNPQSNVNKFSGYNPDKYTLDNVTMTIRTDEAITPGRPPCLTQKTVGKFLQPLTRELVEVPPRPTIDELPDAVIENMVQKDKAFWVDKPGANAYTLHDAYYKYGMTTEMIKPNHQDVFPRSYQYDLDCVRYRRQHGCDSFNNTDQPEKPPAAHCRDCQKPTKGLTAFQLAWTQNASQKRWRYYPDLTSAMTSEEIRSLMGEVGRPFQNEACNWYYENYPPVKYNCILRKFSK